MYYFAFGSNLWLQQMERRAGGSFEGRGVLVDYAWQINERGYANVVACAGRCVHGLVFAISGAAEQRLDAYEGVAAGAYEKQLLDVVLYRAGGGWRAPTAAVLTAKSRPLPVAYDRGVVQEGVLVYLSTRCTAPGAPRPEYIARMNHGIRDAVALGVPASYFDSAVRPAIPVVIDDE